MCLSQNLCWVCGENLGKKKTLIGGPMSLFNRMWGDLPCHPDCSDFSAKYCPHMSMGAKYRTNDKPMTMIEHQGMIQQNPTAYCQVTCERIVAFQRGPTVLVAPSGNSFDIQWWCKGEKITSNEACDIWTPDPQMVKEAPKIYEAVKDYIRKLP